MANLLVSLTEAKAHLRITSTADEAVIIMKAQQASDLIVDYLKATQVPVVSITSSGGLATVTTLAALSAYGLSNGNTVTVRAGEIEYTGDVVITVTGTTTFTYPITGTPTTPATGSLGIRVTPPWTDATVPPPVKSAVLLMLTHLYDHRGEDMDGDQKLWEAIARMLAMRRDPALA